MQIDLKVDPAFVLAINNLTAAMLSVGGLLTAASTGSMVSSATPVPPVTVAPAVETKTAAVVTTSQPVTTGKSDPAPTTAVVTPVATTQPAVTTTVAASAPVTQPVETVAVQTAQAQTAPATTDGAAVVVTLDDIRAKLQTLAKQQGREVAIGLLKQHGAETVGALDPAHYAAVLKSANDSLALG